MTKIAIIDGDVLCHQACRPRWEKKARMMGGTRVIHLDANGKPIPVEYTEEDDAEYLEFAWKTFQKDLNRMVEELYCTEYLMAIKGENNFRDLMYPNYKMNRHHDPSKMNKFVPILRTRAAEAGLAIPAHGMEADDMLRIWAEDCRHHNTEFVICSIDKDLLCIPGTHYRMRTKELVDMTPIESARFFYEQLLKGDPTDNIPGIPGVGDVGARKKLAGLSTEEDFQEVVVSEYMTAYGDEWRSYLLSNGKMLYLLDSPMDSFRISHWEFVKFLESK